MAGCIASVCSLVVGALWALSRLAVRLWTTGTDRDVTAGLRTQ